jgi:hypothetical protein
MAKLAIATGHTTCMQVFNDLQYSNWCKVVSISWPVAMATLPLNTAEYQIGYPYRIEQLNILLFVDIFV